MIEDVLIQWRKSTNSGTFYFIEGSQILPRFINTSSNFNLECVQGHNLLKLNFIDSFSLFRETSSRQKYWKFKFRIAQDDSESNEEFRKFKLNFHGESSQLIKFTSQTVVKELQQRGFNKRDLTPFQIRDLLLLLQMPHGANFSVPGAGKTTVAIALNFLFMNKGDKTLVICPKSAFEAWGEIIGDCMIDPGEADTFVRLAGSAEDIRRMLETKSSRFYINYESAVSNESVLRSFLLKNSTHLIIDESHRIKAGSASNRGALCIRLAPLAKRRDILSGTPMPQGPTDIAAQVEFLLPATRDAIQIRTGADPQNVMQGKFVRTRKNELGLPPKIITPIDVEMKESHLAFYSAIADDVIGQFAATASNQNRQSQVIRRNAIRMLQGSVFPHLVRDAPLGQPLLLVKALESGASSKMEKAAEICRLNAEAGLKTVVWSIFTGTILKLQSMLIDLNAEVYFGGTSDNRFGEDYDREQSLSRFKKSASSLVLIANPAAGSEGLSLHQVCHHAVYVDRTYNAAHYLQSIDRIHRLGLSPETLTYISVIRSKLPDGIPNIDMSVWRRLSRKVDDMERLLSDPDLREIVAAEDDAEAPVDMTMDRDDVLDLILEMSKSSDYTK
jgi:SNF2 family DNA or RNA helicase